MLLGVSRVMTLFFSGSRCRCRKSSVSYGPNQPKGHLSHYYLSTKYYCDCDNSAYRFFIADITLFIIILLIDYKLF